MDGRTKEGQTVTSIPKSSMMMMVMCKPPRHKDVSDRRRNLALDCSWLARVMSIVRNFKLAFALVRGGRINGKKQTTRSSSRPPCDEMVMDECFIDRPTCSFFRRQLINSVLGGRSAVASAWFHSLILQTNSYQLTSNHNGSLQEQMGLYLLRLEYLL
jgi:hypothetical protein